MEKWKFQAQKSWKSGNFEEKTPGKVEIYKDFILEKWKFYVKKPWKSGNFERNLPRKVEKANLYSIQYNI